MSIFRKKIRFNVSVKISVSMLLLFFSINFLLVYNLKSIGYVPNTVSVLENKPTEPKNEEKSPELDKTAEVQCITSNLTTMYNDKISLLKNELSEFFLKTPNSMELPRRYDQFQETLTSRIPNIEGSVKNYFTDGQLVNLLKNSTLLKASNLKKGSQLKLFLQLSNNLTAIFKPQWYPSHEIITGSVYAGKDRHFGEVVAFYLSLLLDFKNVPVAAIRRLDIKELLLVSDRALLETFVLKNNSTCFYGVCTYCSPSELVCTDTNVLEGSVIVFLSSNYKLKLNRNPWCRTYKCDKLAKWETDNKFCSSVRKSKFYSKKENMALIFDLIDAAIFDFLIDNGDRHHYEYVESNEGVPKLIFFDNGKSFGNPYVDHIDILAPLYQCCLIRNSTWNTLLHLRGGNLSHWLRQLLEADRDLVFDEKHFDALDRRLLLIFTVLKDCFKSKGMQNVVLNI